MFKYSSIMAVIFFSISSSDICVTGSLVMGVLTAWLLLRSTGGICLPLEGAIILLLSWRRSFSRLAYMLASCEFSLECNTDCLFTLFSRLPTGVCTLRLFSRLRILQERSSPRLCPRRGVRLSLERGEKRKEKIKYCKPLLVLSTIFCYYNFNSSYIVMGRKSKEKLKLQF